MQAEIIKLLDSTLPFECMRKYSLQTKFVLYLLFFPCNISRSPEPEFLLDSMN